LFGRNANDGAFSVSRVGQTEYEKQGEKKGQTHHDESVSLPDSSDRRR